MIFEFEKWMNYVVHILTLYGTDQQRLSFVPYESFASGFGTRKGHASVLTEPCHPSIRFWREPCLSESSKANANSHSNNDNDNDNDNDDESCFSSSSSVSSVSDVSSGTFSILGQESSDSEDEDALYSPYVRSVPTGGRSPASPSCSTVSAPAVLYEEQPLDENERDTSDESDEGDDNESQPEEELSLFLDEMTVEMVSTDGSMTFANTNLPKSKFRWVSNPFAQEVSFEVPETFNYVNFIKIAYAFCSETDENAIVCAEIKVPKVRINDPSFSVSSDQTYVMLEGEEFVKSYLGLRDALEAPPEFEFGWHIRPDRFHKKPRSTGSIYSIRLIAPEVF